MTTETSPMVVSEDRCNCETVHLLNVYHRDFPELRAEGETPSIAAAYLVEKLLRLQDAPLDPHQHGPLARAIEDVRGFIHERDLAT